MNSNYMILLKMKKLKNEVDLKISSSIYKKII